MPAPGFEHSVPASGRPQSHVLYRTATGIRWNDITKRFNMAISDLNNFVYDRQYLSLYIRVCLRVCVFVYKNTNWHTSDESYRRAGTLIVETIYLQLIQNRYMFRSFTLLQCSHQHCLQPVASDVKVVGYLKQRLLC